MVVLIAGFGNALLDISVCLEKNNDYLYKKYDLEYDGQKEIDRNTLENLLNDINKIDNKKYNPGGCAFNTIRIIQQIFKENEATMFFGSIGTDSNADILKKLVKDIKIRLNLIEKDDHLTGTCIALIKNANRSLVAYLGASEQISMNDLNEKCIDYHEKLTEVKMIYLEGFFIAYHADIALTLYEFCNKLEKMLVFNLSGKYLYQMTNINETLDFFVQKSHITFGNLSEFIAYQNMVGKKTMEFDDFIMKLIRNVPNKIIVITDGPREVICYYGQAEKIVVKVPELKPEQIQDTTGAGDSFVSGFLAAYLRQNSIKKSIEFACQISQIVIQQYGCTLPDYFQSLDLYTNKKLQNTEENEYA